MSENRPELEMKQAPTTKDAAVPGEQKPSASAADGDNRRRSDVAAEAETTFSVMTSQDHRNESAEATNAGGQAVIKLYPHSNTSVRKKL